MVLLGQNKIQKGVDLGVKTPVIRRYCNRGFVPHVRRTRTGYRIFDECQIEWLRTVRLLDECGFSTAGIKTYRDFTKRGDETISERRAMLETKKHQLWQEMKSLQQRIDFIEQRQEFFDRIVENPEIEHEEML